MMKIAMRTAIVLITGVSAAILGQWAGDRLPTTETLRSEATPREVRAGDTLFIAYEFRRYRLCARDLIREVTDANRVRFELGTQERPTTTGQLGRDGYVQQVKLPERLALGPAVYRVTILDKCNPLHNWWPLRKVIEVPFTVVAP